MKNAIIYIAGRIKGDPDFMAKFAEAEAVFACESQVVLNPAKLLKGLDDEKCLPVCLQLIELADVVMMLPGWRHSLGATTEAHYAMRQGKPVVELDAGLRSGTALTWAPEGGIIEERRTYEKPMR